MTGTIAPAMVLRKGIVTLGLIASAATAATISTATNCNAGGSLGSGPTDCSTSQTLPPGGSPGTQPATAQGHSQLTYYFGATYIDATVDLSAYSTIGAYVVGSTPTFYGASSSATSSLVIHGTTEGAVRSGKLLYSIDGDVSEQYGNSALSIVLNGAMITCSAGFGSTSCDAVQLADITLGEAFTLTIAGTVTSNATRPQGYGQGTLNSSLHFSFLDGNPFTTLGVKTVNFVETNAAAVPEPSTISTIAFGLAVAALAKLSQYDHSKSGKRLTRRVIDLKIRLL